MHRHPKVFRVTLAVAATLFASVAAAQVTLYGGDGMRGQSLNVSGTLSNLERSGFNDRASSMVVQRGQWEVCEHANFRGDCRIVQPGQYPSLAAIGLGDEVSSIRPLRGKARYAVATPAPEPPRYDYYPRHDERVYQANVTSVRAVGGAPEQRCWIERERVGGYSANQIGGAVVGGILGGVLGHQIGGGRGQDVATALGAVGGAVVGSNVAGGSPGYTQDIRRCESVPASFQPAYWDVTYVFRGQQHRVQLAAPPGPTLAVNGSGEPRV